MHLVLLHFFIVKAFGNRFGMDVRIVGVRFVWFWLQAGVSDFHWSFDFSSDQFIR